MAVSVPLRSLSAHPKLICTSHGGVRAFWVTCPVRSAAGGRRWSGRERHLVPDAHSPQLHCCYSQRLRGGGQKRTENCL